VRTALTDLLGVEYPIVQTGMGWVSTPRLTSATSNAGGFGILAAATMSLDELSAALNETHAITDKPFGVNMRADQPDVARFVDVIIDNGVKAASFAMAPRRDLIERLHAGGVLVIPSIGAKRHAQKVLEIGVDAVLVQGGEGGGHTGPVPTTLLLPQVVDTVGDLPVIAAGGFFDGRGLVAARAYGAAGIAMGTRFLLTSDCEVPDTIKRIYLAKSVTDTVVTSKVDGVPHRVLRTEFIDALEKAGAARGLFRALNNAAAYKRSSGTSWMKMILEGVSMKRRLDLDWTHVLMAANTPMMLRAAMVSGDAHYGVMASGQVVGLIDDLPSVAELLARIMREADDALKRLGS
jgi:NAD(P)H-dependent flavin oxidoreductase YrpB (nitropropane dioxygenase family)